MPVYDYKCKTHGIFHELATMSDHAQPAPCPQCGEMAGRVIMVAPELLKMDSAQHQAHARNEESRHAPKLSTVESRATPTQEGGCGCGDHRKRSSNLMYTARGEKHFPSMRPWMISH